MSRSLFFILAATSAACSIESTTTPSSQEGAAAEVQNEPAGPSTVTQGQSTEPLEGTFQFSVDTGTFDTDPVERMGSDLCHYARYGASIAIVDIVDDWTPIPVEGDICDYPYNDGAVENTFKVVAVSAGDTLPVELTAVAMTTSDGLFPSSVGRYLVALRSDNDEWFWGPWAELTVSTDPTIVAPSAYPNLPSDWATLVRESQEMLLQYSTKCGGSRLSDQEFKTAVRTRPPEDCADPDDAQLDDGGAARP